MPLYRWWWQAARVRGAEGWWSSGPHHYIETENNPLSNKMNATVLRAKALQSDYVLCMGSDDSAPQSICLIRAQMREGIDFIGLTDFYFYHIPTRKAMYWGGYPGTAQRADRWRRARAEC